LNGIAVSTNVKGKIIIICMILGLMTRLIRKIQTDIIQNRIGAGKKVFFENPLEEMAFRYVPGNVGEIGKYYVKCYGKDESEISFDSTSVLMGIMEGKLISRSRYERYHLIEGTYSNRKISTVPVHNQAALGHFADTVC
jgi:hypothetical protein